MRVVVDLNHGTLALRGRVVLLANVCVRPRLVFNLFDDEALDLGGWLLYRGPGCGTPTGGRFEGVVTFHHAMIVL